MMCSVPLFGCAPTTQQQAKLTEKYPNLQRLNCVQVLNTLAKEKIITTGDGTDMVLVDPNGGYKTVGGSKITPKYLEIKLSDALKKKRISQSSYDFCIKRKNYCNVIGC